MCPPPRPRPREDVGVFQQSKVQMCESSALAATADGSATSAASTAALPPEVVRFEKKGQDDMCRCIRSLASDPSPYIRWVSCGT